MAYEVALKVSDCAVDKTLISAPAKDCKSFLNQLLPGAVPFVACSPDP